MRLAASCIAWAEDEHDEMARLLAELGVEGVELVPGMLGGDPATMSSDDLRRVRERWEAHGLRIVALQALTFGRSGMSLFGPREERDALVAWLDRIAVVAGSLGAGAMVFGSPGLRRLGNLSGEQAFALAFDVFGRAGQAAAREGTCLCIEPNPPRYGCEFVTDARSAIDLVRAVDEPGFALHLDAGALHLAGDPVDRIDEGFDVLRHFHLSEVDLAPLTEGSPVPHAACVERLRSLGYARWVSIEMKRLDGIEDHRDVVRRAILLAKGWLRG